MKHRLEIVLSEKNVGLPIHVVWEDEPRKITLSIYPEDVDIALADRSGNKYAFIWRHDSYAKVAFDDILWIKAEGSYSTIRLAQKREMTVSFHLALIEKVLPFSDFVRIHRSYIVNLKHVDSLIGNCLKVEDALLSIGREYRERILGRFVFIGVRRNKK